MASSLCHVGVTLFKRNNHEEAKPFFSEALELKLKTKDQDEIADTQHCFATLLFESGDIEQSLEMHRHALDGCWQQLAHDNADLADSPCAMLHLLISKNLHEDAFGGMHAITAGFDVLCVSWGNQSFQPWGKTGLAPWSITHVATGLIVMRLPEQGSACPHCAATAL